VAERDLHGPFVNIATLCRRAEPAGVSLSLIEVLQAVVIRGPVLPPPGPVPFECFAVVALQSGFAQGTYPLRVEMVKPNREIQEVWRTEVAFRGEEHGETLVQRLELLIAEPGVYWFDVLLRERLLTRFPLRVEFELAEAR
jgi:hypothetical protein